MSGHGEPVDPERKQCGMNPTLAVRGESLVLKGHDFSRAANATKKLRALAPEGMLDRSKDLF
jgi:hypothetical protein